LHDRQSPDRLRVVRAAIDVVHELTDAQSLFAYAGNIANPPEARLFAGAKCQAAWELAAAERRVRPDIDLRKLAARTAGLDSSRWRNPFRFGCLFDVAAPGAPEAPEREQPLDETTMEVGQ